MNPVALKATLTLFGPLLAVGVLGLIGCAVHAWYRKREDDRYYNRKRKGQK